MVSIKLQNLDEERIKSEAAIQFPDCKMRLDKADLYMKEIEDGTYISSFHDSKFHVSTQYAYEDIPVHGNMTRYKMYIYTIELLVDAYSVNYVWQDCYYVAFENNGDIQFMKYAEFLEFIKGEIH